MHAPLKPLYLGSVAEKVIRHAAIPVMALPAVEIEQAQVDQQAVRTLIVLDGSPLSEAILESAASLTAALAQAAGQQGMVRLMRIVDIPPSYGKFRSGVDSFYDAEMRAEARHEDEQYLRTIAARFTEGEFAKYQLAVSSSVATDTDVAEALVQQAEQEHVGFIAMAAHGRGGVQHWALGSITERVLHATKRPLFILRPQHGAVQTESME